MGTILNGIVLHGGTRPYGATFLIFSDYMRPAVRLAAIMKLPVIYVWTHDSVGPRRGRPHPPADRTALRAAGDSRTRRGAPRGRQRDGVGVAARVGAHRSPHGALPDPAEPCPPSIGPSWPMRPAPPAADTSWPTRATGSPR
jgi:hypothetical protein